MNQTYRTSVLVAICFAVGIGLGIASTVREFAGERLPTDPFVRATPTSVTSEATGKLEVVGGTSYNFGEMDRHAKGEHEFVFRNIGTAPIGLKKGQTTCKCTMNEMENTELKPGESTTIKLSWEAKTGETDFSQSAEIITTNYPAQPIVRLHVYGKIIDALRTDRPSLSLGSISASEETSGKFKVFSFRGEEPLDITNYEFVDQDKAEFFTAEFRPLTEEELTAEPSAKSGVEVTIQVRAGLPLGNLGQSIKLTTNLPKTSPLTVPIEGRVVGDIMVIGPGTVSDRNMVILGDTKSAVGKVARLFVLVKGPYRNETQLTLKSVTPDGGLLVELGEPSTDNPLVTRYPLTITIPPGAKPATHLGTTEESAGVVRIATTHPQIKEFVLLVRYAVTE
jgi:hypothetical protein